MLCKTSGKTDDQILTVTGYKQMDSQADYINILPATAGGSKRIPLKTFINSSQIFRAVIERLLYAHRQSLFKRHFNLEKN